MKALGSTFLIALLGVLGGCSTSSAPEPSPGPSETTAAPVAIRTIGAHAADVAATKLYARPNVDAVRRRVQVSSALPPTDKLATGYLPEETTHTDVLHRVPKGLSGVYKVPIDTTEGDAHLFLTPQVEDADAIHAALRDIEVLDPNGVVVNVRAAKVGVADSDLLPMSAIPLAGRPVGTYTVRFKSGAAPVGLAIEARLLASNIVMKLKPSTLQHLAGNESVIDATLMEGNTPITGAHVVADMVDGESANTLMPVIFTEVGNGVYRAAIHSVMTDTQKVGAYLTDVRADGAAPSGAQFFRHGRTGFHFGVATARLGGVAAQRTITDNAGLVTAFEVDLNLENRSVDRLELSGKLTVIGDDGQEHVIAIAHTGDAFDAGNHVVTLRFDAGAVRLTKAQGTFYVRDVQLFSLGTNTLFHRQISGDNRLFPNIARSSLRKLETLTPAQAKLVADGVFQND